MRISRMALAGTFVAVLASVPAAWAVSAQDDETATDVHLMTPASVSGVITLGSPNQPHAETAGEPPVEQSNTNWGWTLTVEMDDPRLSGTYETNMNEYVYSSGEKARTGVGTLANEGGSWSVEFRGFGTRDAAISDLYYVEHWTGEGGYEGLSAMLLSEPGQGHSWEVTGIIVPGTWPEPPEWVLPPAE
jgi:hypothetical protein